MSESEDPTKMDEFRDFLAIPTFENLRLPRLANPFQATLLFKHESGGRLYQSGVHGVPDDLTELGVSLIVAASKKYVRQDKHENVIYTLFNDELNMPDWRWKQIEEMVIPAVEQMAAALEAGQGVLSVCRAGLNRSSLLSGLTLLRVSDLTPKEVVNLIRCVRGIDCLHNPDFRDVVLNGF